MDTVATGLLKGCLAGLGLALIFFAISGLTYLTLNLTGMPNRLVLFIAIGSGPIVGTLGICVVLWLRALRIQAKMTNKNEEQDTIGTSK
ncbi:MAG: hypothetical protein JXB30_03315 [Anaerolineae bacterium]|nr:hypothetical protein [Anaerolineae bacterium]